MTRSQKVAGSQGIGLGSRRPGAKRRLMASVPLTTEAIGFI